MPTKRQLEIFLAVAKHGSMRLAAEEAGISQPSVSKHIRTLEQALGSQLFLRSRGSRAKLSDPGRKLVAEAAELVSNYENMVRDARANRSPATLQVFVRSFLFSEFEDTLANSSLDGFDTQLKYNVVGNDEDIEDLVKANSDSVGLYRSNKIPSSKGIEASVLKIDTCHLFASSAYIAENVEGDAFKPSFRAFVPPPSDFGRWLTIHLEAAGVRPDLWQVTNWFPGAVLRRVVNGEAAGVFVESHAQQFVETGALQKLSRPLNPIYLNLISNSLVPRPIVDAFRRNL